MTDSDWLDAIEARLRALPVEWDGMGWDGIEGCFFVVGPAMVCYGQHSPHGISLADRCDAEFIAHAPEDIAALVAAVRERDAALARVEALAADFDGGQYNIICRLIRAALADPKETA